MQLILFTQCFLTTKKYVIEIENILSLHFFFFDPNIFTYLCIYVNTLCIRLYAVHIVNIVMLLYFTVAAVRHNLISFFCFAVAQYPNINSSYFIENILKQTKKKSSDLTIPRCSFFNGENKILHKMLSTIICDFYKINLKCKKSHR